ncbi:hypothetical protein HMPREF1407_00611 [Helicobacter pylori GAM244Ai]|nr:hypothetical protein HMPREF1407_00611 [Helicobacter pylori GAM244Ai]
MFLGVAFKFFTDYNFSLLFHLVFCLLDFGFLLLMVFASCFLFSLIVFRVCVLFFLNLISFV